MHSVQIATEVERDNWDGRVSNDALSKLEEHIQYKFNQPHLALMALTHSSRLASLLPSYEVSRNSPVLVIPANPFPRSVWNSSATRFWTTTWFNTATASFPT